MMNWRTVFVAQLGEESTLWNMRSKYWHVMNICQYFSCSKSEPTTMFENSSLNELWWAPSFTPYIGENVRKRMSKLKTIDLTSYLAYKLQMKESMN